MRNRCREKASEGPVGTGPRGVLGLGGVSPGHVGGMGMEGGGWLPEGSLKNWNLVLP